MKMDHSELTGFINSSMKNGKRINSNLQAALYAILPSITHYKEEDKEFSFKIALGADTEIEKLKGRYFAIQTLDINSGTMALYKVFKEIAIFCAKDANVFVIQNDTNIVFGVYFSDIHMTGKAEKSLKENDFIIFEPISQYIIEVTGKDDSRKVVIDFELVIHKGQKLNSVTKHGSVMCCKWDGIFEKVKKEVHGTICLVVDPKWEKADDKNFSSSTIVIDGVNLALSHNASPNQIFTFNNNLDMFISMLDYDGTTIIDTNEDVRAYHAFCNNTGNDDSVIGGARKRVYERLKSLPADERKHYLGIYFQSQEGERKFYNYQTGLEYNAFDPTIMNLNTDSEMAKIVKAYKQPIDNAQQMDPATLCQYYVFETEIETLLQAHNGINNFSAEVGPAYELAQNINMYLFLIESYRGIRKLFMNTLALCFLGNVYGYSWEADASYTILLSNIEAGVWREYIIEHDYFDSELLWLLSTRAVDVRFGELKNIISAKIQKMNITKEEYAKVNEFFCYTAKEFGELYIAYEQKKNNE